MGFRFDDVRVISAALAGGEVVLDDLLIGARVSMVNALVCDLDPEGFDWTQIFSGGLQIRAPGAIGDTGTFLSRQPTRAVTRGLNWYRNVSVCLATTRAAEQAAPRQPSSIRSKWRASTRRSCRRSVPNTTR
jgi:hypothetical protein